MEGSAVGFPLHKLESNGYGAGVTMPCTGIGQTIRSVGQCVSASV